jgi:hypothetical protein
MSESGTGTRPVVRKELLQSESKKRQCVDDFDSLPIHMAP